MNSTQFNMLTVWADAVFANFPGATLHPTYPDLAPLTLVCLAYGANGQIEGEFTLTESGRVEASIQDEEMAFLEAAGKPTGVAEHFARWCSSLLRYRKSLNKTT